MQASTALEPSATPARELISSLQFEAVTETVIGNNKGMDPGIAEQIVEEALKFVAACAKHPGARLRPSRVVDEGWHALILHTATYRALCKRLGRFIHHTPERPDPSRHSPQELGRTQALIVKAGFDVDRTLWLAPTDPSISVAAECEHTPKNCASCFDGGGNGDGKSN
ncbi:glycine-rich domain-containing protein [Streptomyces sp. NPDC059063]|uniref:glycine-rich domain-containing protein n=1 Tax=unclassified Streptomyces TaxID=2593676 RepID=UPI0036A509DB